MYSARTKNAALPVVLGVIAIALVVFVVVLLTDNKKHKQQAQAVRLAAQRRIAAAAASAGRGGRVGAEGRPRRIGVGAMPAGVASRTPPAAVGGGSIWEESLPERGGMGLARSRLTSASGPMRTAQVGGNARMFHYTDAMDPLSANDLSIADLAPAYDHSPAKTSDDVISKMYTFDNVQAATARSGVSGYLRPEIDRSGIGRLGERRDYGRFLQEMRWRRDEFASSPDALDIVQKGLTGIPSQYLDVMYDAAVERGIQPSTSADGIGNYAAGRLAGALEAQLSGHAAHRTALNASSAAALRTKAAQVISTTDAATAQRQMRDIGAAVLALRAGGSDYALSSAQGAAVSKWIHQGANPSLQSTAYELNKTVGGILVPPVVA